MSGLALSAILLIAASTQAQYIRFKTGQVRVTVPLGATTSTLVTNLVQLGSITNDPPVALSISGTLPAGANATLDTATAPTNNTPVGMTVTTGPSTPQGVYSFSLDGAGFDTNGAPVAGRIYFTLQVAHIWAGSTNAAADGAGLWSDASKWLGGVPGPGDDVVFTDASGQTNQILGTITNYLVNSVIPGDLTIGSLRFTMTNTVSKAQTIRINTGSTVSITGTNGFSFLRDYLSASVGLGNANVMNVAIFGTNSTLIVSNANANFALLSENAAPSSTRVDSMNSVNLTDLGTFRADVYRFGLGDYQLYPNFTNLSTGNSYNGSPRNFAAFINLARTNIIRATYVDPNDFTNSVRRDYSLTLGNNEQNGTSTNPQYTINWGISNALFLDSICFAHGSCSASSAFPLALSTNYPCIAIFRGPDGGRMSMWAQSDLGQGDATMLSGSNDKNNPPIDFSRGTIDALVDVLALARDRIGTSGGNAQANLNIGAGTFDVNTAYIGYQTENGHTNVQYCTATLLVTAGGVVKVNDSLTLGYTTEDPTNTAATAQNNRGTLTIQSNATVMANTILVGGLTKLSTGNTINLNTGGKLIVSNTIAGPDMYLSTLSMSGGSTLAFHIDGNQSTSYAYVSNLTVGAGNFIQIAALNNMNFVGGIAQVPLITYVSGTPTLPAAQLPAGFIGSASIIPDDTVPNQWDLYVNTNAPKTTLVWRAPAGVGNWDTQPGNKVWLDTSTGLLTNFNNGDSVTFDDTPGFATTINQNVSVLLPGGITMSNSAVSYTITGIGLQGGGILTKSGTGALTISGTIAIPLQINGGTLAGSGTVAGVTVGTNAVMNFSGTVNNGIDCAGVATLASTATVSGGLSLRSPAGAIANFGAVSGPLTLRDGTLLVNSNTLTALGSSTVASNATFINAGPIGLDGQDATLTVSGTFKDYGVAGLYLSTLTIGNGGTFIPGGDAIGTTTVLANGQGTFPGRVAFLAGSTNIFKINPDTGTNTVVLSGTQDLGPSQGSPAFNGCTLLITNVGTTSFAAGQVYKLLGNSSDGGVIFDSGSSTNAYPVMAPGAPGPELAWDLSDIRPDGLLAIHSVSNAPIHIAFDNTFFTSISTNVPPVTNNNIIWHFAWPTNYIGWKVQQQVSTLKDGLGTNWSTLFISAFTNDLVVTNVMTTNQAIFYRMAFP